VEALGSEALLLPTDVADESQVEAAAAQVESQWGAIDVWVNDAMATLFCEFADISPEDYRRATEVTYLGTVWGTRAALKRMLPRNRGTIVQVGSALAYRSIPLQSPYCGAKAAIRGFQQSLRTELRNRGSNVHTTMVQLPGLNTPQFVHARAKMPKVPQPVPPVYQPEVAADAVHFAAHHKRREVWVGIPTVYTIMGSRVAEWAAQRYLGKTAVSSQQSDKPLGEAVREGNLFKAPTEDEGARGPYGDQAHEHSVQLALSKLRR
jgi:NAD(P)-dependent dehydrogenase (short-subunit alcohol dehydrogenase family)